MGGFSSTLGESVEQVDATELENKASGLARWGLLAQGSAMPQGQLISRRCFPVSQAATAPKLRTMNPPTTTTMMSITTQPNTRHPKDFMLDPIEEESAIGLVQRAGSLSQHRRSHSARHRPGVPVDDRIKGLFVWP